MQDVGPSVGFDVKQQDYGLEAIDQSFQVITQQFDNRLMNYELVELRRKPKAKLNVLGQHSSYGSFGAWE